jgi:hypothetical protein
VIAFCDYELRRWTSIAQSCTGQGAGDSSSSRECPALMIVCKRLERGRRAFALATADREQQRSRLFTATWRTAVKDVEKLCLLEGFCSPV